MYCLVCVFTTVTVVVVVIPSFIVLLNCLYLNPQVLLLVQSRKSEWVAMWP